MEKLNINEGDNDNDLIEDVKKHDAWGVEKLNETQSCIFSNIEFRDFQIELINAWINHLIDHLQSE